MQDKIEIQKMELERLYSRLAEIDAERDSIRNEVKALRSSMTKETSSDLWSFATVTAVCRVAVVSYLSTGVLHDAQSNVNKHDLSGASVMSALESMQIMRAQNPSAGAHKPASDSGKKKPFFI